MASKTKKSPLSKEFVVAVAIYEMTKVHHENVWYNKLVEGLEDKVSKNTVTKSLNTLLDWGIIKIEFGETDKGRAGKLLTISNESTPIIRELYQKYWKKIS
jgi:hypothetical protein